MSVGYSPVQWNVNKYIYDAILLGAIVVYILLFIRFAPELLNFEKPIDRAILRMRAFGSCAFLMLTFILCIGPLARLNRKFLPLLYNRRHFGVLLALVALTHAQAVLDWYHAFSPQDPWVSLLSSNSNYDSFLSFPFEFLGIVALIILLAMAATSHDFWLNFLTPQVWKFLHMGIYLAYGLVVMHIALGLLQTERHFIYIAIVGGSLTAVIGLHLMAGLQEWKTDQRMTAQKHSKTWIVAGHLSEISNTLPENTGFTLTLESEVRVAIFRHQNRLNALSNACAHQNGPLGEGRVIDGCVTCPWHGFQYDVTNGQSPPPFTQKVQTYQLRKEGDLLLLNPQPFPPGTPQEPVDL